LLPSIDSIEHSLIEPASMAARAGATVMRGAINPPAPVS